MNFPYPMSPMIENRSRPVTPPIRSVWWWREFQLVKLFNGRNHVVAITGGERTNREGDRKSIGEKEMDYDGSDDT